MNEVNKQQLSALMDGELAADQARFVLRAVAADMELGRAWARYHLAAEVIRGQALPSGVSLGERVVRQLQGPAPAPRSQPGLRWLRYGMGGGIAAGVALAALVWMQPPAALPGASMAATEQAPGASVAVAEAAQAPVSAAALGTPAPDFSSLLRQSGAGFLDVQPAAAVRGGPLLPRRVTGQQPLWLQVATAQTGQRPHNFYLRNHAPVPPPVVTASSAGQ